MSKRILVTGATGLIGKEIIDPLHNLGYEIHAIARTVLSTASHFVTWHKADLFNQVDVEEIISSVRPTHLVNLAWTTTGNYLSSTENYRYLSAGINLLSLFARNGGRRAIYAGTCFEYKMKDRPLTETDELDCAKNTYTFCKDLLHQAVERLCRECGISFGYGRIFYVFGHNEDPHRLCGGVVDRLKRGESITVSGGNLLRDYMYTKDIAAAFAKFIDSSVTGSVNIGTGHGITITNLARNIGEAFGRPELIHYEPNPGNQPPVIVANVKRLHDEVQFQPMFDVASACRNIVMEVNDVNH